MENGDLYKVVDAVHTQAIISGDTKLAFKLAEVLDFMVDRASDPYELCPYIDSYMEEVDHNLMQDEYEWRRISGDGNAYQSVVRDVLGDHIENMVELEEQFGTDIVTEIIVPKAAARYCGNT